MYLTQPWSAPHCVQFVTVVHSVTGTQPPVQHPSSTAGTSPAGQAGVAAPQTTRVASQLTLRAQRPPAHNARAAGMFRASHAEAAQVSISQRSTGTPTAWAAHSQHELTNKQSSSLVHSGSLTAPVPPVLRLPAVPPIALLPAAAPAPPPISALPPQAYAAVSKNPMQGARKPEPYTNAAIAHARDGA